MARLLARSRRKSCTSRCGMRTSGSAVCVVHIMIYEIDKYEFILYTIMTYDVNILFLLYTLKSPPPPLILRLSLRPHPRARARAPAHTHTRTHEHTHEHAFACARLSARTRTRAHAHAHPCTPRLSTSICTKCVYTNTLIDK